MKEKGSFGDLSLGLSRNFVPSGAPLITEIYALFTAWVSLWMTIFVSFRVFKDSDFAVILSVILISVLVFMNVC